MQIKHLPATIKDIGPMAYAMILLNPSTAKTWGMSKNNDGRWYFYAPNELAMRASGEMIFPHCTIEAGTRYWSNKQKKVVTTDTKMKVVGVHLTPKAGPTRAENPHLWWDGEIDGGGFYIFKEDRAHKRQCTDKDYHANKQMLEDFLNKIRAACTAEKAHLAKPARTEPVEVTSTGWDD